LFGTQLLKLKKYYGTLPPLEWPSTTSAPLSKQSCFEIFLDGMKPNPTQPQERVSGFRVLFLTHPDFNGQFFFPTPTRSLPTPYLLLFPAFLFPLHFPAHNFFFVLWDFFSFRFFVFFLLFFVFVSIILCFNLKFLWSLCFFFWLFFFFLSCVCVLSSVCGAGEEDYGSNKNKEEREEEEEQYEEQS
jgi:hypothetical protein